MAEYLNPYNPSLNLEEDHEGKLSPFFTVRNRSEKDIFHWIFNAFKFCREYYKPYHESIQENISTYQGLWYPKHQTRQDYERRTYKDFGGSYPVDEELVTNYVYEFTEEIVSRITTFKNSIAVLPANSNQTQDLINAQSVKQLLDTIFYELSFDALQPQFVRNVKVAGESWLFPLWDAKAGEIQPSFKDAKAIHETVPLLDEEGKQVEEEGKKVFVEKPTRVGDLKLKLKLAEHVYPQPILYSMERDWVMVLDFQYVDQLKADYPEKAGKIEPDRGNHWDYQGNKMNYLGEIATVIQFYHRDTYDCPGGYQAKMTTETFLEGGELAYQHGEIPGECLTDLDVPGCTRGISYIRNTRQLQGKINELRGYVNRNMKLLSHPKIIVEIGSINKEHMRAMPTIVPKVPGTKSPELMSFQSTHNEIYQYIEKCKEELRMLSGVHPISIGQVPPGIESGIAIHQLKAEENERYNSFVTKYNHFFVRIAQKILPTISQYYKPSDGRMIRVLGTNNDYVYKMLDLAILEKPYDVRLQNQNALGDTKAAKVASLMELYDKGAISVEELKENLELGTISKVYKELMEPVRTALYENELLLQGKEARVAFADDHAKHYRTHYPMFQEQSFKQLPEEIQGNPYPDSEFFGVGAYGHLQTHVQAMVLEVETEMDFAGQSPKLLQYSQLPGWTLFAKPFFREPTQVPVPGSFPPQPGNGAAPPLEGPLPGGNPQVAPPEMTNVPPEAGSNLLQ